jgi:hypothetical protein
MQSLGIEEHERETRARASIDLWISQLSFGVCCRQSWHQVCCGRVYLALAKIAMLAVLQRYLATE